MMGAMAKPMVSPFTMLAEAFGPAAGLAAEDGLQGGALRFVGAFVHEDRLLEIAGILPHVAAERPQHRDVEAVEL